MDHGTLRELAAGAALDDLEPGERASFEAHVRSCDGCRRLATDLDMALGELALIAPSVEPPRSLRDDVMAAIRAPRLTPVAVAGRGPAAPVQPRPRLLETQARGLGHAVWTRVALASAAVLAILAVGLGAQVVRLSDEVAAARSELVATQTRIASAQAAMAVVADPGHRTVNLHAEPVAPAARAIALYLPGTTDAYLMAMDLPPTDAGEVYQLWVADEAGVHPLGTYQYDGEGPFIIPFGVDLGSSAAA
ncbi:MAG TPA: anti-sigma factor, partial [Candidatus Saccharimonadales bacterium]|nr:anti-sigma factor [Candidatus Saccharimonadales bacterium]